ncbi:MAG: 5-formyltetrahydrofolate cyclo-ligase [Verrucomicrobiaceae bacterium]|nr:MAG: 5-formyltetrahydrofolate cyclo-ligase [Verrucomicrobiaceae bacterium]
MRTKAELRREMRAHLRALGTEERDNRSTAVCKALLQRPEYIQAQTVAIFDPLPSEPDISLLWHLSPRRFLYPRIVEDKLQLLVAESVADLEQTDPSFAFREPPFLPERVAALNEVDLILVPGLAFSADGHRMGRGGGYYDRLLSTLPPHTRKLGVCFSQQLLPEIPVEPHDERVDAVVTD